MKGMNVFIATCLLLMASSHTKGTEEDKAIPLDKGELMIEDSHFDLIHGEIAASGEIDPPGDVFGYLVYFLSSGFTLTDTEVQGTGQMIEMHFWTDGSDGIQAGTYQLFDEEHPNINTFICHISTQMNRETKKIDFLYLCQSGTVTVEKHDLVYTITAEMQTLQYDTEFFSEEADGPPLAENIPITLRFTGELNQTYFGVFNTKTDENHAIK